MLYHDTNGFLQTQASLVNMLVTFCGKLECSFLTTTMSAKIFSSTTPKVFRSQKRDKR